MCKGYIFGDNEIIFYDSDIDVDRFFEIYEDYVVSYSQKYDRITFELTNVD